MHMKNTPRDPIHVQARREALKDELYISLARMEERQLDLVLRLVKQLVECHDPDVVEEFLNLRDDPMLGSLLQIASSMSCDLREQLLFAAEELYSSETLRH